MEQLVARRAHNPKVVGSSPAPATSEIKPPFFTRKAVFVFHLYSQLRFQRIKAYFWFESYNATEQDCRIKVFVIRK